MKENVNKKEVLAKVIPVIEKMANDLKLILVEADFVKESGKWHLRIFIYSYEHPITHEDCEKLTHKLDEYLDMIIPVHYYLEVSSPGIERKFKSPKEYNIFKDHKVDIKLKQPLLDDIKMFTAIIVDYNSTDGLIIKQPGKEGIMGIQEANIFSVRLHSDL